MIAYAIIPFLINPPFKYILYLYHTRKEVSPMSSYLSTVNCREFVFALIQQYGHRAKEWILDNIPPGYYQALALHDYADYYWYTMGK